ncbi:MAG: hypothetical protein Q8R98_06525, partial [Rubrivivax sp.]|nr:hypothetical protein [Rubrivivax sp.]
LPAIDGQVDGAQAALALAAMNEGSVLLDDVQGSLQLEGDAEAAATLEPASEVAQAPEAEISSDTPPDHEHVAPAGTLPPTDTAA